MTHSVHISFIATLALSSSLYANANIGQMFQDATIKGEVRSLYSAYNNKNTQDIYATAIGTSLQYELAKYKGFNASLAFRTTHDIKVLSANKEHYNNELSGEKKTYTEVTQAYLNYENKNFNLRIGAQIIDTPLADSDDIRMVPNTFKGYIAQYSLENLSFIAGHLDSWQGSDAGLNSGWKKAGKDGVNFGGINYENNLVDTNLWFYNISNDDSKEIANNAIYFDITGHLTIQENTTLNISLQYLKEKELDNSAVEANIYGAMTELTYKNFTFTAAYNKALKQNSKHSFSGYGGGTLFTNMDSMILDEITQDREANAKVISLSYALNNINFIYAYGDFSAKADSQGLKAHIVEQDIVIEYTPNDLLTLSLSYIIDTNKQDSKSEDFNSKNIRAFASFNF